MAVAAAMGLCMAFAPAASAQVTEVITVPRGNSELLVHPASLERVLITDPGIADVVAVSAREIVINGIEPGTTTLLFWDVTGQRFSYTVRVTVDASTIEQEFRRMFPTENLTAMAIGNTVIIGGSTPNSQVAERALSVATSLEPEATILDHIIVPDRGQVLLRVRVAEVNRNAMRDLGANFSRIDPFNLRGADEVSLQSGGVPAPSGGFLSDGPAQTFSDAVNLFLFHESSNVAAFIRALQNEGHLRTLAEPNLMTLPGETASFLAGGEFPFPVVQGGAQGGAVTIQFREFGVRLGFTPTITNSGAIRLEVEPEVSSLDFAGGLSLGGFQIPVVLARRAQTVVEVQDGQTFAIAGLMDNEMSESVRKVPFLGDIPILGALFRSSSFQQSRTELLVLVTPHVVTPGMEAPPLPTGEVDTWNWFDFMRPDGAEPASDAGADADGGGDVNP